MKKYILHTLLLLVVTLLLSFNVLAQTQIPSLQVCNSAAVKGDGSIFIPKRIDAGLAKAGTFDVRVDISCNNTQNYGVGSIGFYNISLDDSLVSTAIESTSIDQITTTGRETPTIYITGRCKVEPVSTVDNTRFAGCKFWAMIADNYDPAGVQQSSPDIVSFLVFNGKGERISYGTGPLRGDIFVAGTSD